MKTIEAEAFQQQCLSILDHLEADGVLIARQGEPVARLVPIQHRSSDLLGALVGKLKVKGDIMSTDSSWDAES